MKDIKPVFIADSCIGGLSVVRSMWNSGSAGDAVFLADYAINPLGVKDESAISDVVSRWFSLAKRHSDALIIACNTLSVRYRQLPQFDASTTGLKQVISMVDCFKAMVRIESERLINKRVLVIGTEYTANQSLYLDLLRTNVPGVQATAIAATDLERKVARFVPGSLGLSDELKQAIGSMDAAVLACTCFPIVLDELKILFPDVIFLDPGAYCSGLLQESVVAQHRKLHIKVTGDVVSAARATEFASTYLDNGVVVSS